MKREESFPINLGAISRDIGNGIGYPVCASEICLLEPATSVTGCCTIDVRNWRKYLVAPSTPRSTPNLAILQRHALFLSRLLWVVVTVSSIALFLLSLPPGRAQISDYAARPEVSEALKISGIPADIFVFSNTLRRVIFVAVFVLVGILLFVRKSAEPFALFVSLTLIMFGAIAFINTNQFLSSYPLWIQWLGEFIQWAGTVTIGLFFYLFPDGRFAPRWTRYAAFLWILLHI